MKPLHPVLGPLARSHPADSAEALLRESDERLRLTLAATNVGLYDLNLQTGEAVVNAEYARMLGYELPDFHETNEAWRKRLHPDDCPTVYQTYTDYITGRIPEYRVEFRQCTKDGRWVWILSLGKIVAFSPDGRPTRMLGTHVDITEQKKAKAALEQSEERLRQAVSFASIGIFDHDHIAGTLVWSKEFRAMLGIPQDQAFTIADFLKVIHPEDRHRVSEAIRRSHDPAGDGLYEAEYRISREGRAIHWLTARGQTFFGGEADARRPIRTVGAVIDITESKRAESRLARAKEDLEARVQARTRELAESKRAAEVASEAKSRFLAMMSHEIRTPLNGITGFLHLLRKEPLSSQQQRWIEMAFTSANTLLYLINDILDFSKIEAGKLTLHPVTIDLHATLRRAAEPFAQRAAAKGLEWCLQLDAGVPRFVDTDPDRLAQILANLLSNAVKFTDSGSIRLAVKPGALPQADSEPPARFLIRCAVTDTGPGLTPDDQVLLFKPFSQVDNSITRRHGGTGLGLGICKHLVELMNGRVGVDSAPGQGSTFWFELPISVPTGAMGIHTLAESSQPAMCLPVSPALPTPAHRVLLAEDNEINQELACEMIRFAGCDCDCVVSGQEAISAALSRRYDLLFMDCRMPGLDGYAAARIIRENEIRTSAGGPPRRRLPIVAMTAHALEGDREACLAAGMDDYLAKPLEPAAVVEMVRKWIRA